MNAPAMPAKKNSASGSGTSRSRGVPATASTATAAPIGTGNEYGSNRGGSLTVNTTRTLLTVSARPPPSDGASDQMATRCRCVP